MRRVSSVTRPICLVIIGIAILLNGSCGSDGGNTGGTDSPPPTAGNLVFQAYVKASNTGTRDQYSRVALDGNTLVVGAPGESSAATGINGNQTDERAPGSGAVYVFTLLDGSWIQQAYLKASNTESGDVFGVTVALDGDTIAVGAWAEASAATGINGNQADNNSPGSGAVYVFTRTAGVWSQQAYVKATNSGAGGFGSSVALDGDTLVVGAKDDASAATGVNGNQADFSAPGSGAVYVFTRTGGVWSQQAYIKASNTDTQDAFGISVSLADDTLAVGALQESSSATGINGNQADNNAQNSGAVYIFTRSGGIWTQQAYVKASNTGAGDLFGRSVTLSGNTLAVGADDEASAAVGINGNQADDSALNSGAVYVFTRTGGAWTQQAYVKASNPETQDGFGQYVALDGDSLAIGAPGEASAVTGINGDQTNNNAINSGAVYVFRRTNGVWAQQYYVKASNTGARDQFGGSVALNGDILAVGADQEDSAETGINGNQANNSAAESGAVYLYVNQ